jgi:sugar lactone lactonase YvrE
LIITRKNISEQIFPHFKFELLTMQIIEPDLVVDPGCRLGEGPLWHPQEKRVYWVDIPTGVLYRCTPEGGSLESFPTGEATGGFTILENKAAFAPGVKAKSP